MATIINDPQQEESWNRNHVTGGILPFHIHSINLFPTGELNFPLTSANPEPAAAVQETLLRFRLK